MPCILITLPLQFNLMACIEDRRQKYRRELAEQQHLQVRAPCDNVAGQDCGRGSTPCRLRLRRVVLRCNQARAGGRHASFPRAFPLPRSPICHHQDRIRAKLANSAPPPLAEGAGDEPALPGDPDTLAAALVEAQGEAERCVAARTMPRPPPAMLPTS